MDQFFASVGRILEALPAVVGAPIALGLVIFFAMKAEAKKSPPIDHSKHFDDVKVSLADIKEKLVVILDRTNR